VHQKSNLSCSVVILYLVILLCCSLSILIFLRFSKPAKLGSLLLERSKAMSDMGNPLESLSMSLSDRSSSLVLASREEIPWISSAVNPFERKDNCSHIKDKEMSE
jgi:hypothetical protein